MKNSLSFLAFFALSALLIIQTAHPVSSAKLTVLVENYDGMVNLTLRSGNFSLNSSFAGKTILDVPEGDYFAYLSAMNLTFVKRVNVTENTTLTFNLAFSSDPGILSISYHTVIYPAEGGFEVTDVVIVRNTADVNFRGNLTIPLPDCRNLRVVSSSLSYMSYVPLGNITFTDLLVAEKSEGQITLRYSLSGSRFERSVENATVFVMTPAKIGSFSKNLKDLGVRTFSGRSFRVLAGNVTGTYYVDLVMNRQIDLNPIAIAGIVLISGSVFLALMERRGRWKL